MIEEAGIVRVTDGAKRGNEKLSFDVETGSRREIC
jgi:hypothetical protein